MKDFISAKSETRIERGRKGDASKAAPAAKRGATGRGGARQCRTPSSPASRVWRLASLVLCAGVVGGGAWWWMARSEKERDQQEGRVVKKAAPTVRKKPAGKAGNEAGAASGKSRAAFVATNGNMRTSATPKPGIEKPDVFLEPRKKGLEIVVSRPPGMIFTNAFENFIADVLTAKPGERFLEVELGDWFDEEFKASLKTPIGVLPGDSDEVAATKEAVAAAKKSIAEHVKGGAARPRDVVLEARAELNKIADYRDKLQEGFHGMLLQEDDPQILRMYVKEANELLKEYGALPLDAPGDDDGMLEMVRDYREFNDTNEAYERAEAEKKAERAKKERTNGK